MIFLRQVVSVKVILMQRQLAEGFLLAGEAAVEDVADGGDAVLRRADLAHAVLVLHQMIAPLYHLLFVVPRPVMLGRRLSNSHFLFFLFLHLSIPLLQPINKNGTPSISLSI